VTRKPYRERGVNCHVTLASYQLKLLVLYILPISAHGGRKLSPLSLWGSLLIRFWWWEYQSFIVGLGVKAWLYGVAWWRFGDGACALGGRWDGGRGSLDRADHRPPPPPASATAGSHVGNLLHIAGETNTLLLSSRLSPEWLFSNFWTLTLTIRSFSLSSTCLITRRTYYHRQVKRSPCNHLVIGALRLPILSRHQPISWLIPS